jgi:ABC-type antimicrobial peptide transport system permease subunit
MALGARRHQVVFAVLEDAMILTLVGLAVGIPLALWSTRVVKSLLFSVGGTTVEGWVAIVVVPAVTLIAAYLPARRAAGVDPVIALRAN